MFTINKTPFSDAKESNELNIKTNDTAQKIVISKVLRYLILYLSIEHYGHLSEKKHKDLTLRNWGRSPSPCKRVRCHIFRTPPSDKE